MEIKGHTTIELTDKNTGEVEIIESDNMVTNFIDDLFTWNYKAYNGLINNEVIDDSGNNTYMNAVGRNYILCTFFGGILLLNKTVTENANNFFPPEDATTTGNSIYGLSETTTLSPELGVFNEDESSIVWDSNDGLTARFVYDFSTDKGNGTIASVCLCDLWTGATGTGNTSLTASTNIKTHYGTTQAKGSYAQTLGPNLKQDLSFYKDFRIRCDRKVMPTENKLDFSIPIKLDTENNLIYSINVVENCKNGLNNGKLLIARNYFPFSSVNPLTRIPYRDNLNLPALDSIQVDLPTEFSNIFTHSTELNRGGFSMLLDENEDIYLITMKSSISGKSISSERINYSYNVFGESGDTVYIWKLGKNLTGRTVTSFTIPTNMKMVAPCYYGTDSTRASAYAIYKGYLYFSNQLGANQTYAYVYNSSGSISTKNNSVAVNGLYRLQLSNPTNIEVVGNTGDWTDATNDNTYGKFILWPKGLFYRHYSSNTNNILPNKAACFTMWKIDSVSNKAYPVNDSLISSVDYIQSSERLPHLPNLKINDFMRLYVYSSASYSNSVLFDNAVSYSRLSTINNLSQPVVKTADKTMKVTYVLTGNGAPPVGDN